MEFKRRLNTCDANDVMIDTKSTMTALYSWGNEPSGSSPSYHTNRGATPLILDTGNALSGSTPDTYVDIRVNDGGVDHVLGPDHGATDADRRTTYYYHAFKIPDSITSNGKKHITKIDVLEDNAGKLHHILLYECTAPISDADLALSTSGVTYRVQNMPSVVRQCQGSSLVFTWAIGNSGFDFPEDVGYPMTATVGDGLKYGLMVIHYDNYDFTDFTVTDGLRIYYDPDSLRTYEAGVLWTGVGRLCTVQSCSYIFHILLLAMHSNLVSTPATTIYTLSCMCFASY